MKKNLGTILAGSFIVIVLLFYLVTYQVRYTEVAVLKTFGEPSSAAIDSPGLHWKWPKPIQDKVIYDKRVRVLEDRTEEARTSDGKNIILTTFTLWKIAEPVKFTRSFPNGEQEAESKIRTTVASVKSAVTGNTTLDEFISTDPSKRRLKEIEKRMMAYIRHGIPQSEIDAVIAGNIRDYKPVDLEQNYGIKIMDFGIKKLALPKSTTTSIFAAMKAHETRKADRYRSEGDARAKQIKEEAEAMRQRILAEANRKKSEIEAEVQARVGEYYREFEKHPTLQIYLDMLDVTRRALKTRSILVWDTDSKQSPFFLFNRQAREAIRPGADIESIGMNVSLDAIKKNAADGSEEGGEKTN